MFILGQLYIFSLILLTFLKICKKNFFFKLLNILTQKKYKICVRGLKKKDILKK